MSEPFVFDPRCEVCKTPYGAVPIHTSVTLHVRPLEGDHYTAVTLVCLREFAGDTAEFPLIRGGCDGDRRRFSLTFPAPDAPDLVWYHFRLSRADGTCRWLDQDGYHDSGDALRPWQLTVYDDALTTPEWFGQGITYQIFPDRFCRLEIPDAAGMIGNRWVHQNWQDFPVWAPDPDGEIRNRDFFGGSLQGIIAQLDHLKELSVSTLYLCPIFESASNHRYNTADYHRIDPMLGTEADFRTLCDEAHKRGMRVILDGVFNHTGSESLYFNADGYYPTVGAAQSKDSPWFDWFRFTHWPDKYESWWGIKTLPAVEESCPSYVDYIIDGEDSVVRRWLRAGADGWRLDVADELPDWFIARIRTAMDETKPGSFLVGEVWEDGTTKIAYSERRKYLLGHETHGLMNYPFRTAAIAWLQGGDAVEFCRAMEEIREHYPAPAFYSAMNFLGTHDTARILTLLGARTTPETKAERADYRLDHEELTRGRDLLKLAALLLYTFPGCPTVYYGDEAGMQGFEDPLNRLPYPWGHEDNQIRGHYRLLGRLRTEHPALQRGSIEWLWADGPCLAYRRVLPEETVTVVFNAGAEEAKLSLPAADGLRMDLLTGRTSFAADGQITLTLPPRSGQLLI